MAISQWIIIALAVAVLGLQATGHLVPIIAAIRGYSHGAA